MSKRNLEPDTTLQMRAATRTLLHRFVPSGSAQGCGRLYTALARVYLKHSRVSNPGLTSRWCGGGIETPRPASAGKGGEGEERNGPPQAHTTNPGFFSLTLIAALGLALAVTVIIAPVAAMALAAAGLRFPFPRIFDRTVMLTLFAALLLFARRLKLADFLRQGFSSARIGLWQAFRGLALATGAMAVLFALTSIAGGNLRVSMIAASALRYLPAAVVIALIEEGFFRAFLLTGIEGELGSSGALLASSAIFALVHLIRSPARFYLTRFEPMAGAESLAAYAERIIHPEGRSLLGLFLLGLVLGEAFILTRRAYCSIGLHAGFVLGAKTWRLAVGGAIPRWLAGPGSVPLIAAPATWTISAIMLIVLPRWLEPNEQQHARPGPLPQSPSPHPSRNNTEDGQTGSRQGA